MNEEGRMIATEVKCNKEPVGGKKRETTNGVNTKKKG